MKKLTSNLSRDLAVGRALGEGVPISEIAMRFKVTEKRVYQLRAALLNAICVKAGRPELFSTLRPTLTRHPLMFLRLVEHFAREVGGDAASQ